MRVSTNRLAAIAAIAIAIPLVGGCGRSDSADSSAQGPERGSRVGVANAVAVVDLEAVAQATGRAKAIQRQLERREKELREKLTEVSKSMRAELEKVRANLGEDATTKEKKRLQQLIKKAQKRSRANQRAARLQAQRLREKLLRRFRESVRPVAQAIAEKRGFRAVFASDDSLLWHHPKADLTDEVIAELRARDALGEESDAPSSTRPSQSSGTGDAG